MSLPALFDFSFCHEFKAELFLWKNEAFQEADGGRLSSLTCLLLFEDPLRSKQVQVMPLKLGP